MLRVHGFPSSFPNPLVISFLLFLAHSAQTETNVCCKPVFTGGRVSSPRGPHSLSTTWRVVLGPKTFGSPGKSSFPHFRENDPSGCGHRMVRTFSPAARVGVRVPAGGLGALRERTAPLVHNLPNTFVWCCQTRGWRSGLYLLPSLHKASPFFGTNNLCFLTTITCKLPHRKLQALPARIRLLCQTEILEPVLLLMFRFLLYNIKSHT